MAISLRQEKIGEKQWQRIMSVWNLHSAKHSTRNTINRPKIVRTPLYHHSLCMYELILSLSIANQTSYIKYAHTNARIQPKIKWLTEWIPRIGTKNKNNNNNIKKCCELFFYGRNTILRIICMCVCVCSLARSTKTKTKNVINIQMYTHMSGCVHVYLCLCVSCILLLIYWAHVIEISTWTLIGRKWRQLSRDLHFNGCCMYVCVLNTHGICILLLSTVVKIEFSSARRRRIPFGRLSYTFYAELNRSQFSCSASKPK